MTLIDRPRPAHRYSSVIAEPVRPAAPAPLGGRYVTARSARPATEGTYVTRSASVATTPLTRGSYVTTSTSNAARVGAYVSVA
jgi:hypothetical protein